MTVILRKPLCWALFSLDGGAWFDCSWPFGLRTRAMFPPERCVLFPGLYNRTKNGSAPSYPNNPLSYFSLQVLADVGVLSSSLNLFPFFMKIAPFGPTSHGFSLYGFFNYLRPDFIFFPLWARPTEYLPCEPPCNSKVQFPPPWNFK